MRADTAEQSHFSQMRSRWLQRKVQEAAASEVACLLVVSL
jgi:hypothetical protein